MNKKWKRWIALGLAVSCLGSAAVLAEGVQTKLYMPIPISCPIKATKKPSSITLIRDTGRHWP